MESGRGSRVAFGRMQLEGATSSELRAACMRQYFTPIAKAILARLPEVQCVAHAVSQYWCDEAVDAVHEEFRIFLERDPKPPYEEAAGNWGLMGPAFAEFEDGEVFEGGMGFLAFCARFPRLQANSTAITAFAAFCPEQGTADDPSTMSSAVYALARRGAAGEVEIEVVGAMLRPEWEDRFDVGFAVESTGRSQPLAPSAPAARPHGLWAWLRRLFRG